MTLLVSSEISDSKAKKMVKFSRISKHIVERYNERFAESGKIYSNAQVNAIIRNLIKSSTYLGLFSCDDGSLGHRFKTQNNIGKHSNVIIRVSENWDVFLTIHHSEQNVKTEIKVKNENLINFKTNIKKQYEKEIRKISRKINKLEKDYKFEKLSSAIKIAEINLNIYKTKSENVVATNNMLKNEITSQLNNLEIEISTLKKIKDNLLVELSQL